MAREDENPTEKKAEVQEEAKTEGKSVRKRKGRKNIFLTDALTFM